MQWHFNSEESIPQCWVLGENRKKSSQSVSRVLPRVPASAFKVPPMTSKVFDLEPLVLNGVEEKVLIYHNM